MDWPAEPPEAPPPAGSHPRTRRPLFAGENDPPPVSFAGAPWQAPRFALPDGTPLVLTMTKKSHYCSLTGAFSISWLEEALLLLFLCRPQYDTRARWVTPAPVDAGEPDFSKTAPDYFTGVRLAAERWADALPHTWHEDAIKLAVGLWLDAHETMAEPLEENPQKKRAAPPTGPQSFVVSSPGSTPASPFSIAGHSATSTPPSTLGTAPMASPPSPPPSGSSDSLPPGNSDTTPPPADAPPPPP